MFESQQGLRTSLYGWSRCDVPMEDVLPEKCLRYDSLDCLEIGYLAENLRHAADDLRDGFDLVMVYYGNVDEEGHMHGPDSPELYNEVSTKKKH